jgi:hypothetical protein
MLKFTEGTFWNGSSLVLRDEVCKSVVLNYVSEVSMMLKVDNQSSLLKTVSFDD